VIALKLPLVPHVAVNVEVPAYPVSHVTVIVSPVSPLIAPVPALSELATSVAAQLLAVHVRVLKLPSVPHVAVGNPAPAPVYPGIHSTVTVVPVLPEMSPADALSELATLAELHVCAAHVIALKLPLVPHVAVNVEVPAYPVSHVTVIVSPVSPLIAPVPALSELATSVAAQLLAVHVRVLKLPSVPHVVVGNSAPAPVYPVSHVTATVSPVVPVISAVPEALSELATLAVVHASAVHVIALKFPPVPQVAVAVTALERWQISTYLV